MRLSRWQSSRVSGPARIGTEAESVFLLNSHRNRAPPYWCVSEYPLGTQLAPVCERLWLPE